MADQEQIRVAVLEQKAEVLEHFVERLDSAIEKIAEVNNNVSRMLAVHEERLSKQEQIDGILFTKIDELRDKMDGDHDSIRQRLSVLERRIWTAVGALGTAVVLSNPQAIKMMRPLFSADAGGTIPTVVAVVDGSR
tara:strand:+ start:753 stop:1160 length:408 start_codon:yes stop_codon:yes gene_type:complete